MGITAALGMTLISAAQFDQLEAHEFKGLTQYQVSELDGRAVIEARSRASASGLIRKQPIDLTQTPWLSWCWQVAERPDVTDEQSKAGDDYAARVYIIVREGRLPWQLRVISYVWSSVQPSGTRWSNAYTDRVTMISVRGTDNGPAGEWLCEQRNVLEDIAETFEDPVTHIDAVAIMTDSDDSETQAGAWFGEVKLQAQPTPVAATGAPPPESVSVAQ